MFNPERLLGGLLRGGMRRKSGLGSLISGGAALGLVGVAMEAVEHFMNKPQGAPPPVGAPSMPPPVPGANPSQPAACAPPPPPGSAAFAPPVGIPVGEAVLLIRAMIAAAYADGAIDEQERSGIIGKLRELELSSDEQEFISSELLAPKTRKSLVSAVTSPQMARQVYLVSLLAIEVDTDAERLYLNALARELALDQEAVEEVHRQAGVPLL